MLNDFSQAGADGREKIVQTQMGDDRVVHFEQQSRAIPFVGQLPLGRLGALVVQHVVDGERDLLGHLLHEAKLRLLIDSALFAAETHRARAAAAPS